MDTRKLTDCLRFVAGSMIASEPHLTALDQATGDGDHGIGIARGFTALRALLNSPEFVATDVGDCLRQSGTCLMASMGGASGALFGTLFRTGGTALAGLDKFDAGALCAWLEQGLTAIQRRGGASPGDKTLVDALDAAARQARLNIDAPLRVALHNCAAAAMQGAEATRDMLAVYGRAKNIGERARGHCDPGAVSMALILEFISVYVQNHDE